MSTEANYYKLGLFVIGASVLALAAVLAFGAGVFLQKGTVIETYLDESVQGLDVGAPVKVRGVKIGNVSEINLVRQVYGNDAAFLKSDIRYVMVRAELDTKIFQDLSGVQIRKALKSEDDQGLRARLASQGLTGQAYLELDYIDPERYPPLQIGWEPQHFYIPSAPSTLTGLTESADKILRELRKVNLEGIIDDLQTLMRQLTKAVGEAEVTKLQDEALELMSTVREVSLSLQKMIEGPEMTSITQSMAATFAQVQSLTETIEARVNEILTQFEETSKKISGVAGGLETMIENPALDRTLTSAAKITQGVETATADLPETVKLMNQALRQLNRLLAVEQDNIRAVLENLRVITDDVRSISGDAREYPAQVLFGEPPRKLEPSKP